MARIELLGQSYQSKSPISSGQECLNLYGEYNFQPAPGDPQSPSKVTYYPIPGTKRYTDAGVTSKVRCFYRTSKDQAYCVIGQNVYFLANNKELILVGVINDSPNQVFMSDNGQVVVIVDGANGWAVDMSSNAFGSIISPSFYGADNVVFLDTFFVFNRPNTNQYYISLSNVSFTMLTTGTGFDPLDIAAKSGFSDNIVGITTVHRELWLIGELTTEVWIGTGAADFYFQQVQGAYIQHGCAARYSIATQDILVFFLMQDQQGAGIVVQGGGYELKEISTPKIVSEFRKYSLMSDAIGFCFQIEDHAFYALVFPTADKGWLYDLRTGLWSEWNWLDPVNGTLHRPRANCCAFVYNANLFGDHSNGVITVMNPEIYTEYAFIDGPITHIKTFPHVVGSKFERIFGLSFIADMEVGTIEDLEANPEILLSWSNDRGISYGNPVPQTLGRTGETLTTITWKRLGMSRDRVYKLQWSAPMRTALNGGFLEIEAGSS